MSEGSVTGSDIDIVDLTSDEYDHPAPDNHDSATPAPQEIFLAVNGHGEPICHMVDGPEAVDPMDVDDIADEVDDLQSPQLSDEESLFVEDDGNGPPGPPSPPSSDGSDSANDSENSEEDNEGDDADDRVIQQNQPPINGGNPGGDDPDDDGSDNSGPNDEDPEDEPDPDEDEDEDEDNDSINDQDVEGDVLHGWKNERAELHQCLDEEHIDVPDFQGNCVKTCLPLWIELAHKLKNYRNLFLKERIVLRGVRSRNRIRATQRNRNIRALIEAVRESYAANQTNVNVNERLCRENAAIRELLSEEDLEDFPDAVRLPVNDMFMSLPEHIRVYVPEAVRYLFRHWRQGPTKKPRKTEREWPKVYRRWILYGRHPNYDDWGKVYQLACKEENMSWALGRNMSPKTHPHLRLRVPTEAEEARALGGEGSTPQPHRRDQSAGLEEPFPFNDLPEVLQIEILRLALVFDGEVVHAISRLDPMYEPASIHRNCNNQLSLFHRFHIGREAVSLSMGAIHPQRLLAPLLGRFARRIGPKLQHLQHIEILWIGSQRLTYEIDEKNKYTSRRTHDLAFLPAARRLKTIAIHLSESAVSYMRRKHEPPQIVQYMVEKTANQPNFRRNRALRTLQGVDYLYCLRGVSQVTLWDYDKYHNTKHKVPVRDWTFVRDINESVRREKDQHEAHLSQLRYLAPMLGGLRPSSALAELLEAVINPPAPPTGLLSPPPEDEALYPRPQSPVDLTSDDEDSDLDDGSNVEDQGESEDSDGGGSDDEDDGDSDDGDDGNSDDGDDGDSDDEDDDGFDDHPFDGHGGGDDAADFNHDNRQEEDDVVRYLGSRLGYDSEEHKYEPGQCNEAWPNNGAHYEIMSDSEDEEDIPSPVADEHAESISEAADDNGEDISEAVDADADQAAMPPPPAPARDRISEGPQGEQREQRDRSASLFVTSPERERQTPFAVKVETPPPRTSLASGAPTDNNAVRVNVTPPRETREESDLFASPTRYNEIVPQGGDRTSPIDLTRDLGLETPVPPSRSPSRSSPTGSQGQEQNKRSYGAFVSDSGDENDADDEDDCVVLESPPKRARRFDDRDDDGQSEQSQPS
ncbi:hypothetical protein FGRMN_9179 [Fusarium graminum]|nr:hypothetical protein FGRMN_9179 [Fusarium graminum]